jgi:uncharacterized protein YjiS (DUF1127 family)
LGRGEAEDPTYEKENTIMSTLSDAATQRAAAGAIVEAVGGAFARWWVAYTTWRIEQWAIGRLTAMSDRELKDVGIVRSQIEFAVKGARERTAP